jgi:hypothetical protein
VRVFFVACKEAREMDVMSGHKHDFRSENDLKDNLYW